MKIISRCCLILFLVMVFVECQADNGCNPQLWIRQAIIQIPSVKMSDAVLGKFDFSPVWMDNRVDYLGYIGDNYQHLHIHFNNIHKVSPTEYAVTGYSEVKTNRCDFNGTITIGALYERKEPDLGVDNWMEGKVKQQGFVIADFSFSENQTQKGSGVFFGSLITKWYIDAENQLLYDDIEEDSDDYANNQFLGQWSSYTTHIEKPCAWGQYRIPCSGDLDIGAGEFSVNPKYLDNGWRDSTVLIDISCDSCVLFIRPTIEQIKQMKSQYPNKEDFYTMADDANYYTANALEYLESRKINVIYLDSIKTVCFNKTDTLDFSHLAWDFVLYNKNAPLKIVHAIDLIHAFTSKP